MVKWINKLLVSFHFVLFYLNSIGKVRKMVQFYYYFFNLT